MLAITALLALLPSLITYSEAVPVNSPANLPLPQIYDAHTGQLLSSPIPRAFSASATPGVGAQHDMVGGCPAGQPGAGVVEWANECSQSWKSPQDTQATSGAYITGPSHLYLNYTLKFESCNVPEVFSRATSNDPGIQCNQALGTVCQQIQKGTVTYSDAYHLGTKLSITLTESATVGVPAEEAVTVGMSVTSEFSEDYTTTNTTSFEDDKTWNIPAGMTCVPTQVWWETKCTQSIEINSFKWYAADGTIMWPDVMGNVDNLCTMWQSAQSSSYGGPPSNDFQWLIAGNNAVSGNFKNDLESHFDLITQICSGTMPAPVGLEVSDKNTGNHKSYVGCEW